jgi:hypothetical protein
MEMAFRTQLTTINLDISAVFGDHADGFDVDKVQAGYVAALMERAHEMYPGTDSVIVHANGDVTVDVADAERARGIDWKEVDAEVDITPILAGAER